jgi:hypothetical protein
VAPVCALLALAACSGKPQPSQDFVEASQRFNRLYGQHLDAAYAQPEMTDVEAQLARVPPDSLDAPAAQALLTRIREGRARTQKQQADTQAALVEARKPAAMAAPPEREAPPAEPEAPDAGQPDAGTPGPQVGTPESELVGGFRGCFGRGAMVEVQGRGPRQTWELQGSSRCRLEYPAHADSLVVVEEAKVLMVTPKSSVQTDPADAGR